MACCYRSVLLQYLGHYTNDGEVEGAISIHSSLCVRSLLFNAASDDKLDAVVWPGD